MMNMGKIEIFQGNQIEILEMILKRVDNQLELMWKIYFENTVYWITFSNVSGRSRCFFSANFSSFTIFTVILLSM